MDYKKYIKPQVCAVCGTTFTPNSWNSKMTPLCSEECKRKRREENRKVLVVPCAECGKPVECKGKSALGLARRGIAYCSEECKQKRTSRIASERMAETNRKYASQRMKENNPMSDPVAKEKMKTSMRTIGFRGKRGGNGELTPQQEALANALGWATEVSVSTGHCRDGSGYPSSYKVDIANEILKVAIEVDGKSHKLPDRKEQDQKKTELLESLGWTVLRFWNEEVTNDLTGCVQTVLSTISKLKGTTPTQSAPELSSTTATTAWRTPT